MLLLIIRSHLTSCVLSVNHCLLLHCLLLSLQALFQTLVNCFAVFCLHLDWNGNRWIDLKLSSYTATLHATGDSIFFSVDSDWLTIDSNGAKWRALTYSANVYYNIWFEAKTDKEKKFCEWTTYPTKHCIWQNRIKKYKTVNFKNYQVSDYKYKIQYIWTLSHVHTTRLVWKFGLHAICLFRPMRKKWQMAWMKI